MKKQPNQFLQFSNAVLQIMMMILMIPLYIIYKLTSNFFKLIDKNLQ
jgi:hypothetical protein